MDANSTMNGAFQNPAVMAMLGGLGVVLLRVIWKRLGIEGEASLPVQLASINTKLAGIETTLELIKNDAHHAAADHDELKADFWDHMHAHHSTTDHGNGWPAQRERRKKPRQSTDTQPFRNMRNEEEDEHDH